MKEKICLDLDGVVFNSLKAFCNLYNDMFNSNKIPKMITKWNFWDIFEISEKMLGFIFSKVEKDKLELLNKDIPKYVKILYQFYYIDILTCRNKKSIEKTLLSLEKNDIHYNNLYVLGYGKDKSTYDYDIFIDDNPNMIDKIKEQPRKTLLLYNHPYNQDDNLPKNVIRMNGFDEIFNYLINRYNERLNNE